MELALFIEGKHDEKFFAKLFEEWNYEIPKIKKMGGYSEINVVADFIIDNHKNGVTSIVIIDCDIEYAERERQFLKTIPENLLIDKKPIFNYYIINGDDSIKNLEDLLLKIAETLV